MKRYYELWDAIQNIALNVDESEYKSFYTHQKLIPKEDLAKAVTFLYPLVEGINYCQRDSSLHTSAYWLVHKLREFYQNNPIIPIEDDILTTIFDKRMVFFKRTPIHLQKLFSTSFKGMEKEDTKSLIQLCGKEIIENFGYPQSEEMSIKNEVAYFIAKEHHRGEMTVMQFFECLSLYDYTFKYLPKIYAIIQTQCASSAAVERSFSEQGLIQVPKRSCLKHENLANLMIVKCNLKFGERQGGLSDLKEHLFKNNPLRHYFK